MEKVFPLRIFLFYQADFPGTIPFFYLFFSCYGFGHGFVYFVIEQVCHSVFTRESLDCPIFMMIDSCYEVTRNSDIECTISVASHDICTGHFFSFEHIFMIILCPSLQGFYLPSLPCKRESRPEPIQAWIPASAGMTQVFYFVLCTLSFVVLGLSSTLFQ